MEVKSVICKLAIRLPSGVERDSGRGRTMWNGCRYGYFGLCRAGGASLSPASPGWTGTDIHSIIERNAALIQV